MTAFIEKETISTSERQAYKTRVKKCQLYTLRNRINLIQIQLRLRDVVLYMKGKGGKDKR